MVEHLLPFLDLASTKELAEAHKLTRQILGRALNWDKMIKRTFPASENIRGALEEGDLIRVRLVAQILLLAEDADGPQLEMSLLHTICGRYLKKNSVFNWDNNFVKLNCSCEQTHQVSYGGFLLLEEAQTILESREQSVLEVRMGCLFEPLLTALSSMASRQQELVKEVSFKILRCNSKESAESFATLVKQSQTVNPGFFILDSAHWILIKGEIRIEGCVAIRKAVEHLLATPGRKICVESERKVMAAGRREDMRDIYNFAEINV